MKNKPFVSIIIVSFNTKEIILDCLDSLYRLTVGVDYEVIVVDNGSKDGSAEALSKLEKQKDNFRLIRSGENLGFGRANNLGAKEAKGKYLLFLNSDTLLRENCIGQVLEKAKQDDKIAAISCLLLNKDGSHQPSGGHFPNLTRLFVWQFFIDDLPFIGNLFSSIHPHQAGFFFLDKLLGGAKLDLARNIRQKEKPDWITGAFMMIPKEKFQTVGGFDEAIFMYTEEMELCYRLKKNGGKIVIDGSTSIIHLGGASGSSYLAYTKEIEGMLYFWKKHLPGWQLPLAKTIFFIGSLLRLVIFGIIGGNEVARHAYREALRLTA